MNKIIKRIVSAVTAVAVTLTAVFVFDVPEMIASAAVSGEGWSLDDNGKLTIENDTGMTNWKGWKDGWDADTALVKSVVIQDGVTSIGEKAFSACNAMSSIAIPNSVTSIGKNAFSGCEAMSSIAIPNSVTSIDDYAFSYCEALSSITIPNGVTSIGNTAFAHCTGLSSITISASVTKMGVDVNIGCKKIETITFEGAPPSGTIAIINYTDGDLTTIYVPCNFVEDYKSAEVLERTLSGKIQPKHNPAQVAAKAATCAAEGNVAHWHCSQCDKNFTDNTCATEITDVVIPKTDTHTWNAGTETTPATCTATGVKTFTCTVCGQTKTETIPKTAHSATHTAAKAATCTANGNKEYWYCSNCKKYFSDSACTTEITQTSTVIATTGHSYNTTWSSDGTSHWHECTKCGDKKDETAHTWGSWELKTEPTLTTTGTAERACDCGGKQTKTDVPALTDTIWTKSNRTDPTLDGTGSEDYTSTDYGKVTITIPALTNPIWTNTSHKGATEEAEGEDVYESTDYGTVKIVLPRLDHTHVWGGWEITKAPTLSEEGTAKRVCTKDDTHIDTKTLPVLTNETVWAKVSGSREDPTLKDKGSEDYTSEYGTVTLLIPALSDEDVWSKTRTDPTLDATGEDVYTSDDYGEVTVTIPALSDETVWTKTRTDPTLDAAGEDVYTSNDYGEVTVTIPALSDETVWTKGDRTDPTLDATGEDVYTSDDYGTVTVTIPALSDETVWSKTRTDPTLDAAGEDVYTSDDYGDVTVTIPALSDETVWTKGDRTDPTLDATGTDVYTSGEFGKVEFTIPKLTDQPWSEDTSKRVEPTTKADGTRTYSCAEFGDVTITVPRLSATDVWSGTRTDPTTNGTGKDVYHSDVYGDVEVTIPALSDDIWKKERTEPTLTNKGRDTYTSEEFGTVIIEIPALSDPIWSIDNGKHIDPTEEKTGQDVYHSDKFGDVTVAIPELEHKHNNLTFVPEVPATTTTEGVKEHWECRCGEKFKDEAGTQPATDDDLRIGILKAEVQAPDTVPTPALTTPHEQLVEATVDDTDKTAMESGKNIKIILKVEDASESTPESEKTTVTAELGKMSGYKLGQYLDVTLLKQIGDQAAQPITNTKKPIKITFEIPAALRVNPEYSVIRIHEGTVTVLKDLDTDPNTVTIETDKFSTYALTYKEKSSSSGSGGGSSSGGGGHSTHTHRYIYDETVIKEPTCTESGEKSLSCSCGLTATQSIPALGHDYRGEITKPATETENGIRTLTCTRCGDSYTEQIEKTGGESKPDDTSSNTPGDTSSGTSDDTSSGTSDSTSSDTSSTDSTDTSTSSDETSDSGDTSSDNSGSPSDGGSSSSGTLDNTSSDTSTSGGETSSDSEDTFSDNSGSSYDGGNSSSGGDNPSTGITVSIIPLAALLAGVIIISNRRKK